jgi:hypothetical protein
MSAFLVAERNHTPSRFNRKSKMEWFCGKMTRHENLRLRQVLTKKGLPHALT